MSTLRRLGLLWWVAIALQLASIGVTLLTAWPRAGMAVWVIGMACMALSESIDRRNRPDITRLLLAAGNPAGETPRPYGVRLQLPTGDCLDLQVTGPPVRANGITVWRVYGPAGVAVTDRCRIHVDYLPERTAVSIAMVRDDATGRTVLAAHPDGHRAQADRLT